MKIGNLNITNIKLGSLQIKKILSGVTLVWSYFEMLVDKFKTRVFSSQGQFEAETCLDVQLTDLDNKGLLDSASFVLTPNGYKENLLFAAKPDKVGTNLLLRSEEFDNAYWTVFGSLTQRLANQTIAPDGTLTADLLGFDGVGTRLLRRTAITTNNNTTYSISLFVKNNTFTQNAGTLKLEFNNNTLSPNNFIIGATINFQTETLTINQIGTQGTGINGSASGSLLVLPNGWYRIQVTGTMGSAAGNSITSFEIGTNNQAGSCFVWGAQLQEGPITDYISTTDRAIINGTIGDLTVTRATTGTRVNSDGLIEVVPYNLVSYSEAFENGYWTKLGSYTLIPNATIAPDGTLTADLFTKTGAINTVVSIIRGSLYTTTGAYTLSFYCKQNVGDIVLFRIDAGGNSCNCLFNFTTKTLTNTGANVISSSYEELPDGWFRLILVGNVIATNWSADIANLFGNPSNDSVYVWGAQIVQGTEPKDYFPTTTRFNVPRLDYSNGSCPSILVEPQRTNLIVRSEEFENASWKKNNSSIIPNATISPSGLMNADKLVENNLLAHHIMSAFIGGTELRTNSIFVKAGERSRFILWAGASGCMFDLISLTTTPGNNYSSITNASIKDYGNGWYRCSITCNAGPNNGFNISLLDNETNPETPSPQYQGDGVSGLYIWGAQRENDSFLTSYIPTTTAAVTRNADVISNTNVSNLIGQTEGTIFLEFIPKVLNSDIARIVSASNTYSNGFFIYINQQGNLQCIIRASESFVVNSTIAVNMSNTPVYKVVLKYSSGNIKIFVNGFLRSTHTATYTFSLLLNSVFLDSAQWSGINQTRGINTLVLWKTQITDEQAINLTTL